MDLQALKTALKPASDAEKKVLIISYNGRGAVTKAIKPLEASSEAGLRIAAMRVKLIEAYSQSGLSAKAFIDAYEAGEVAADLRERLGRWGNIHTQSNFYKNWLAVYQKHGIAGLIPQYDRKRGGAGASFDEKAKEIINSLYLDLRKPSAASVTRDLAQFGYDLKYVTVNRYIKEIPNSVKVFYREGQKPITINSIRTSSATTPCLRRWNGAAATIISSILSSCTKDAFSGRGLRFLWI